MQVDVPDPDPVHEKGWIRLLLNAVPRSDYFFSRVGSGSGFCSDGSIFIFLLGQIRIQLMSWELDPGLSFPDEVSDPWTRLGLNSLAKNPDPDPAI